MKQKFISGFCQNSVNLRINGNLELMWTDLSAGICVGFFLGITFMCTLFAIKEFMDL